MAILILGLILFLGSHAIKMCAPQWRSDMIARLGDNTWKILYSLVALTGFVLIIVGYGQARVDTPWLWSPPAWTGYLTGLLMIPALILVVAGNVPSNQIKAKLGHPMVLGTAIWAAAHLIGTGSLAATVLFGSFLIWASADYISARRRDRRAGITRPAAGASGDIIAVVVGLALWGAFTFYLHLVLIGTSPMG